MPGDDKIIFINKKRVSKTKLIDTINNLTDLFLAVSSGISRVFLKVGYFGVFNNHNKVNHLSRSRSKKQRKNGPFVVPSVGSLFVRTYDFFRRRSK